MNHLAYSYLPAWVFFVFPLLVLSVVASTVGSIISLVYYSRCKKASFFTRLTIAFALVGIGILTGLAIAGGFPKEILHPMFLTTTALLVFNLISAWRTSRLSKRSKETQEAA